MIRMPCPDCGRENNYAPFMAGMRVKCNGCPGWVQLPKEVAAEAPQKCGHCGFTLKSGRMNDCPQCGKRIGSVGPKPPPPSPPPPSPPAVPPPTQAAPRGVASKSWGELLAAPPPPPQPPPQPTPSQAAPPKAKLVDPPAGGSAGFDQPPPASRITRFVARWLDDLFQTIAFGIGISLSFALDILHPHDTVGERAVVILGCLSVTALPFWGYNIYLLSTRGQSLGKRLLGIRIVRDGDYGPVGFMNGFLFRDGSTLGVAVVAFGLAFLAVTTGMTCLTYAAFLWPIYAWANILCIFTPEQQCLHDRIAGTQVVQARR